MRTTDREWHLAEPDPELTERISTALGIHPVTARLLVNRGLAGPEEAATFLEPQLEHLHDPFELRDMPWAVDTLLGAVRDGDPIAVYGDYDVDGVTATAILVEFLRGLGAQVRYFIPERLRDGYGLTVENLAALSHLGTRLVVTTDCGVSNHEEIRIGREMGLDFVVTDHHHPPEGLPEGVPVVNPQREDCPYANRNLSGAGVAFKVTQALRLRVEQEPEGLPVENLPDTESLLEMAAVGTIGDVVTLTGENRVLTSLGLRALQRSRRPGVMALKEVAGISGRVRASTVAFNLAPRLNAAGRLGRADRSVELFLERNPAQAARLARKLDEQNRLRQRLEREILEESTRLTEGIEAACGEPLFLARDGWHQGVIGIVASRLVDMHHRPAVLMSGRGDTLKGSIRSIPGCPLPPALERCSHYLVSYGGHEMAAGFTVHRRCLDDFRAAFIEAMADVRGEFTPRHSRPVDMELDFSVLRMPLMRELARLEPCGRGNSPPLFLCRGVKLDRDPEPFGEKHLRLHVRSGSRSLRATAFKMRHLLPSLWENAPIDLVYTPELRTTRSGTEVVLNVRDLALRYRVESDPASVG